MSMHNKTRELIDQILVIINEIGMKMTVRQVYYQLVSKHIIENNQYSYKRFNGKLVKARKTGLIDSDFIIDTSKPIIKQSSWTNLADFMDDVKDAYNKDIWQTQGNYVEVWLEKDALRGVFEPITNKYDCYLVIGKGYQSYTNLKDASERFSNDKDNYILYFGDFDPTGQDIPRNIEETLHDLGAEVNLLSIALTPKQVKKYNIPPDRTKEKDSRRKKFIKKHGDKTAELDALNPKVLRALIEDSILEYLDIEAYEKVKSQENRDKSQINKLSL